MQINDPSGTAITSLGKSPEISSSGKSGRAGSGGAASASDQVRLSSLSNRLNSLQAEAPEHAGKLSRLGAEFASQRYRVDAGAVSAALIRESLSA